ncbi:MAG TPA: phosphatase PAP2 family protein [Rhizobacter sp.]|nr:phosphatase PAP2 family protein [Rhizobacter sp.]
MGRLVTGAFLFGSSALLDPIVDKRAQRYDGVSAQTVIDVGNAIPFVAFGLAGLSWLSQPDTEQGELGFAAASAGVSAVLAAEAVKLVVDRARPSDNLGARNFGDTPRAQSSFPSLHTTLAWAVLTPYAKQYDAPWLYAAAALTNVARVTGRNHWFSDTVAGALTGYWFGDYFYRRNTASTDEPGTRVWVTPRSVVLTVPFK